MGQTEEHKINHIFIMTGADPNTNWLDGCIALDSKGFIKTGPDLSQENLSAAEWVSCTPTVFTRNEFTWCFRCRRRALR
jgi:alkyl hydroperoxide reductase subunit AhpF